MRLVEELSSCSNREACASPNQDSQQPRKNWLVQMLDESNFQACAFHRVKSNAKISLFATNAYAQAASVVMRMLTARYA